MTADSLLAAHFGRIPEGPILFLGSGDGTAARNLIRQGRSVTVLAGETETRRLGFQHWAAILSLCGEWPARQRRRLLGQVPNALKPGGIFLMEAHAIGPGGPISLDDKYLDPIEVRPELEMLQLARFATVPGPDGTAILQVVGIHPEAGGEALDECL